MQNQERAIAQLSLVEALAADHRPGYSLDQRFYCDDEVFAADLREVVARKWIVAGHVDRVRRKGDYFLFKIGKESIIVVRSDENTINAFYNACRHRGSVICTEPQGHVARLTCPYHAWSYGLNGELLAARLCPPISPSRKTGCTAVTCACFTGSSSSICREVHRSISMPPSADLGPYLDFHGIADAKIAHTESYPTDANWKLVVENFVECYHCAPSHPEFTSMHPPQALIAFGAGPSSGPAEAVNAYLPVLKAWETRAAALGRPIGTIDDGPESSHLRLLLQRTIREGFETRDRGRQAGRAAHGQAHGVRSRSHVSLVQPVHSARRHQRFRRPVRILAAQHDENGCGPLLAGRRQGPRGRCAADDLGLGPHHASGQDHHREQPDGHRVKPLPARALLRA